ncbi:coiled-coil domain-containing protein 112-like [Onthophagus taurus]|uniref:coiled-coil domain-containing protein 112-like n=1 Tax=Onthophagus taurus TaxID=166361 RepID=UPI000C20CF1E|nr:coiled-coil domain-containing protein 112-like [Onthophagus taurus]
MTSTFLAEANKLKNLQLTLEKNEQVLLEHIKKNGDTHIIEFHEELSSSRKKEMEHVWLEYKNIVNPLNKFKSLISKDPVEIISDLNQIKREMFLFGKNIKHSKIRTKECLEKLYEQERELVDEIKLYEQKIVHWGRHVNVSETVYDKNKKNSVDKNVTDFLSFLSKHGGHTNGWNVEDHSLFLKAKSRCKNVNELCEYIHALLPDISKEEIESHEKWYTNYLELKRKHKEAIKNWRKVKSAIPPIQHNNKVNMNVNDDQNRIKSAYSKEKFNKEEMQQRLKQWKQEKEEKLETEKIIRNEMKRRQQEIDERKKERQEEMKTAVQKWKMERLEKEQIKNFEKFESEKQQKVFRSTMANRLIKEFQSQDELFVRRRKELCQPKTKSFDKLPVCNINVPRDPRRLLKPTKQWIARLKTTDDLRKVEKPDIKSIPKLGIPNWRKNLMI